MATYLTAAALGWLKELKVKKAIQRFTCKH